LEALQGGGEVIFANDCDIILSASIEITEDTTIDATDFDVSLSGSNAVRIFYVRAPAALTLTHLTLTGGRETNGGAIYIEPGASVRLENCLLMGNAAMGTNGVEGAAGKDDYNGGENGKSGSSGASALGGAIYSFGDLNASSCRFATNSVVGGSGGSGGKGGNGGDSGLGVGGNGGAGGAGGAVAGGAIYSLGALALRECSFDGNTVAAGDGGAGGSGGTGYLAGYAGNGGAGGAAYGAAVFAAGTDQEIVNCTLTGNIAAAGTTETAGTSTSSGDGLHGKNGAEASGGAIFIGTGNLTNCTFHGNIVQAGNGGNGGDAVGRISVAGDGGNGGNGSGGGLCGTGGVAVVNCTFANCGAAGGTNGVSGAGRYAGSKGKPGGSRGGLLANLGGAIWVGNSIFSTNLAGGNLTNISGSFTDAGYNISSDQSPALSNPLSSTKIDPRLGPFAFYGGEVKTFALLSGSPAIDRVPAGAGGPTFDARDFPRPIGSAAEAGAMESGFAVSGIVKVSGLPKSNVLVSVTGGPSVLTDANGAYSLNVAQGTNEFTPSLAGYEFLPASANLDVTTNTTQNFDGLRVFAVSGRITQYGTTQGLSGVTVLSLGRTSLSDSNGDYTLNVPAGPCVVTALATNGYKFTPSSYSFTLASPTNGFNFAGFQPFTLSGSVKEGTNGLVGVRVSAGTNTTTTDAKGSYALTNLPAGDYALALTLACYHFTGPSSIQLGPSQTNVNFVAARDQYLLTGRVMEGNTPLAGVSVQVGGFTAVTDASGFYSVGNLCASNYLVRPTLSCYSFTPSTQAVFVGSNTNLLSFQAIHGYAIRGQIVQGGVGLPNVSVRAGSFSTSTLADGTFQFSALCPGAYQVTPALGCVQFNPATQNVTVGPDKDAVNFIAFSNNVFEIRGRVTMNGQPVTNVVLTAGNQVVTNNANGDYVFSRLCPNTYRVVPARPGYGFGPVAQNVVVGPDAQNVNFTAFGGSTISGRVTENGQGVGNVAVSVLSAAPTLTDSNGFYLITGVPAGTNLVTPALACYLFNPPNRPLSTVSGDLSGLDFEAVHNVHTIKGLITDGSIGLGGVTVVAGNLKTVTDTNGVYEFADACASTYTIIPSLACYKFNPESRTVSLNADEPAQDFIAYKNLLALRGAVTLSGLGLSNVTVYAGGSKATTDGAGSYVFPQLCSGVYRVTPELAGYAFQPPNTVVSLVTEQNGIDFAATARLTLSLDTNGNASLSLGRTIPAQTFRLDASSSLTNWLSLSTNPAPFQFTDTNAPTLNERFYRAVPSN
jgi:hypothetical protein